MVKRKARRGFTLTEAMVTVAIVAIIASLSAALLLQINRYFSLTKTRLDLQREARGILYVITRELHQAQNASIVIDRARTSQPYYSSISFTKQQGTDMKFYQSGNLLKMQTGGSTSILSKNIYYLAFTFPRSDDMTIVSVSMTLQASLYQGQKKALHTASEKVRIMD